MYRLTKSKATADLIFKHANKSITNFNNQIPLNI